MQAQLARAIGSSDFSSITDMLKVLKTHEFELGAHLDIGKAVGDVEDSEVDSLGAAAATADDSSRLRRNDSATASASSHAVAVSRGMQDAEGLHPSEGARALRGLWLIGDLGLAPSKAGAAGGEARPMAATPQWRTPPLGFSDIAGALGQQKQR